MLSKLVYIGVGYVLGARAGRERYEQIVRVTRRIAGSQTVQSTAGVVQAQLDVFASQARQTVTARLTGAAPAGSAQHNGHNGYHRSA